MGIRELEILNVPIEGEGVRVTGLRVKPSHPLSERRFYPSPPSSPFTIKNILVNSFPLSDTLPKSLQERRSGQFYAYDVDTDDVDIGLRDLFGDIGRA